MITSIFLLFSFVSFADPSPSEVQLRSSLETLIKDPNATSAKLKAAEAFVQLGHPLSANLLWAKFSETDKKQLSEYQSIEAVIAESKKNSKENQLLQEAIAHFSAKKPEKTLEVLIPNEKLFTQLKSEQIRQKYWALASLNQWETLNENTASQCQTLSCEIDIELLWLQKQVNERNFQGVLEKQEALQNKIKETIALLTDSKKIKNLEDLPEAIRNEVGQIPAIERRLEEKQKLENELEFLESLGQNNNYFFVSKIGTQKRQILSEINVFIDHYLVEKPLELQSHLERVRSLSAFSKLKQNPETLASSSELNQLSEELSFKVSRSNAVETLKANLLLLRTHTPEGAKNKQYFLTKAKEILKNIEGKPKLPNHFELVFGKVLFDLNDPQCKVYLSKAGKKPQLKQDEKEEIHFLLAEAYFREGDFQTAAPLFSILASSKNTTLASYSHYKSGWIQFYNSNQDKALEDFRQALNTAESFDKNDFLITLKTTLRKESLLFFSEKKDFSHLESFSSLFSDESFNWGELLAKQFEEQGEYDNAVRLYELLKKMKPEACLAEDINLLKVRHRLLQWNEIEKLALHAKEMHADVLSTERNGSLEQGWLQETIKVLETAKTSLGKDKNRLVSFYQKILSQFGTWTELKPYYLYLANEFKAQKRYDSAIDTFRFYEKTYYQPKKFNEEPFLASYLQTLFLTSNSKITELTFNEQEAIRLVTQEYAELYPNFPFARNFWFNVQGFYLKTKKLDTARNICQSLFNENPADEIGAKCFQNLRVSYYDSKDWEKTFGWSSEILNRNWKSLESFEKPLLDIQKESLFLWAENERDIGKSISLFLKITKTDSMTSLWEKSFFNAITKLELVKDSVRLLDTAEKMQKNFPYSPLTRKTFPLVAQIYYDTGDFVKAEIYFQKWAAAPEFDEKSKSFAYLQLGRISESKGAHKEAQNWYTLYRRPESEVSAAGLVYANERLQVLAKTVDRRIASFESEKNIFLESPIPKRGTVSERLQTSGTKLQELTKLGLEVNQLDSICSLSVLYDAYAREIQLVILSENERNRDGLQKLYRTIDEKRKEFTSSCLKKAEDTEEDAESFREVNQKYGWEWDPVMSEKVKQFTQALEKYLPKIDADALSSREEDILYSHLIRKEDGDTWYHLIFLRCGSGITPYCRVTVNRALEKFPQFGKIQNAEILFSNKSLKTPWLWKAYQQGSRAALGNIVYFNFKQGRLKKAREALAKAMEVELFESTPDIKELAEKNWEKK